MSGQYAGHSIAANVPGDLLTDLQKANLIGDPLYELNFKNASIWNDYTWTYTKSFSVTEEQLNNGAAEQILVFDGIKMGARISVNGKLIGTAADQFLRYEFPLSSSGLLRAGANTLTVAFDPSIDVGGRFMSCTGGWVRELRSASEARPKLDLMLSPFILLQDWAPYTNTFQGSAHTFSKGIWKSVYIVTVQSAAVTHVVPQIFYQGAYPTAPLTEGTHGGFSVDVNVHLWAPTGGAKGSVCATPGWGSMTKACADVSATAGSSVHTLNLTASAKDVKLWWPAGVGAQPLYNITVSFTASGTQKTHSDAAAAITLSRRVGFRHFALVTGNDTDPAYVAGAIGKEGTDQNGMFFRVNGAVVFSKGANMIPMEELEGRMDAEAHHILVQSAVAGGMNTLRVW
jgi:beta-galactosidase/beta-glucuronidase